MYEQELLEFKYVVKKSDGFVQKSVIEFSSNLEVL